MLHNLKDIHAHIKREPYCSHSGKITDAPYFQNPDIENYNNIKSMVTEHGFVIVNCKGKTLLSIIKLLQKLFGRSVKDVGIKKKYIAKVAPAKNGKYYVNSIFAQPLHTDEGYRNEFPRFVSLYCVKPSQTGGVSTIVSVKSVLAELHRLFGSDVNNFLRSNFLQIESAYETINKQVLFELNDNVIGMSYSPILRNITTTELGYKMITCINQFIHDPSNQYRIKLNENDLLIMDNCQVFHGRTAFGENDTRLMLRLWNEILTI